VSATDDDPPRPSVPIDSFANMQASKSYTATILSDPDGSSMTAIPIPFDIKAIFGKVRAPVVVSINSYSFRSTVCRMGGECFIPLRKSNREAAKVRAGQRIRITLRSDDQPRIVIPPADLVEAIKRAGLMKSWNSLSYTHKREHVESIMGAKKPDTRAKRIQKCLDMMRDRSAVGTLKTHRTVALRPHSGQLDIESSPRRS
jgi:hypothetical protein